MQTKVIYLEGSPADEETLAKHLEQGFKLHTALVVQGKVVAYLGRTSFGQANPSLEETKRLTAALNTQTESMKAKAPIHTPPKNKNR